MANKKNSGRTKKNYNLQLNVDELTLLRDILNVTFTNGVRVSSFISESLYDGDAGYNIDESLWQKVKHLCLHSNSVPIGDAAPDFIITVEQPEVSICVDTVSKLQSNEDE